MKKISLRLLSTILAASMIFSTMSTLVFSAETTYQTGSLAEGTASEAGILATEDFSGFDANDSNNNKIAYDEAASAEIASKCCSRLAKVDATKQFYVGETTINVVKDPQSNGTRGNVAELRAYQFGICEHRLESSNYPDMVNGSPAKLKFEFDLWKNTAYSRVIIRYGNPQNNGKLFALNTSGGITVYTENNTTSTSPKEKNLDGTIPAKNWVHYELSLNVRTRECVLYVDGVKKCDWVLDDSWGDGEFFPDFTFEASSAGTAYVDNISISLDDYRGMFEILDNGIAMMTFGRNILKDGKITPLDSADMITKDQSGDIAPYTFFENALGATINLANNSVNVTLDGVTRDLTAYSVTYNEKPYLRLNEALTALGKNCKTFDMITIIGEDQNINEIKNQKYLVNDVKFAINENRLLAEEISSADWELVKNRWRQSLLGDGKANENDTDVQAKLNSLKTTATSAIGNMKKNRTDGIRALFGNTNVTKSSAVTSQYNSLLDIALAYGTEGTGDALYQNENVKNDILYGLEWLYNNLYGENVKKGNTSGWLPTGTYLNSWDFMVGAPTALCKILMIMEAELSKDDINKYLTALDYSLEHWGNKPANRIYTKTAAAALRENFGEMVAMQADYDAMLASAERGTGVREDGMYITHSYYAYSSAYGVSTLLDRVVKVESILSGTKFEFSTPYKYNSCKWIYETFAPIIFNGAITSAFSGRWRTDNFSEPIYTRFVIAAMLDLIGAFGADDDAKMMEIIKRNVPDANKNTVINGLDVNQVSKLNKILENTSAEPYEISKVYYSGDGVVHQKADYGFALAMSSSRIGAWESLGGDNQNGWYQGDGLLLLHLKDDINQYNLSYWKNVNPYHLPGTTVDNRTRTLANVDGSITLTSQDFVGGVNLDEKYSAAAMQLQGHNNTNTSKGPENKSSLMAKKAWFMFDDEVVALGADIDSSDGYEVETIVENRKLNKTEGTGTSQIMGAETITVDGKSLEKTSTFIKAKSFDDPTWVNIENAGGYYFPTGGSLKMNKKINENNYLEMWFSHGVSPTNGTYSYVVLPKKTADETKAYTENPDIEILANNEKVQSVRESKLGVTGTVFWQAGSFNHMTASNPMIVMSENKNGQYKVNISDPTKKLTTATLELDGVYNLISGDSRCTVSKTDKKTTITIDFSGVNGRSLPVVLQTVQGPEIISELKVVNTTPPDNKNWVALDSGFKAEFNDNLQVLGKSHVIVKDQDSTPNYTVSTNGNVLTVTFPDGLKYGKKYTVTLKGNIKSIDGASLGADTTISFDAIAFDRNWFTTEKILNFDFTGLENNTTITGADDNRATDAKGNKYFATKNKVITFVSDDNEHGMTAKFDNTVPGSTSTTGYFGVSKDSIDEYLRSIGETELKKVKVQFDAKKPAKTWMRMYLEVGGKLKDTMIWGSDKTIKFMNGKFASNYNDEVSLGSNDIDDWVTVTLYFDLSDDSDSSYYYIFIDDVFKAGYKIPMTKFEGVRFSTGGEVLVDNIQLYAYEKFELEETSIKNGAKDVSPDTKTFTATFDKELRNDVDMSAVTLTRTDGGALPTYNVAKDGNVLKVVFPNGLDQDTEYSITLNKDNVCSWKGMPLSEDVTITFATTTVTYSIADIDSAFTETIAAVDFDDGRFKKGQTLRRKDNTTQEWVEDSQLIVYQNIGIVESSDPGRGLVAQLYGNVVDHIGLHPNYMTNNNAFYNQTTGAYPKLVKVEFDFKGTKDTTFACEVFIYDEDGAFDADLNATTYTVPWTKYVRVGWSTGDVSFTSKNTHADKGNKVAFTGRDKEWHNLKLYFDFETRKYHAYMDNKFMKTLEMPSTLTEIRGVYIRGYSSQILHLDKMNISTIDAYAKDTFASSKISDYTFFDGQKSSFVYVNESNVMKTIRLIRADYNNKDILVGTNITEISVPAKKDILYHLPKVTDFSGDYYKYFVWEGFDTMKPIKEVKQVNFN